MTAPAENTTLSPLVAPQPETRETSGMVLAASAKAMIQARYLVAMQQPRDIDAVRERLIKECKRPGFAAVARYSKPVAGSRIVGPSIRFAEAALRCMTNITIETVTVYDDREKRIVRVSVTDLEANVPYTQDVTIQKTVERRAPKDGDVVLSSRRNSQGQTVYLLEANDDDIQNKQNALISKAIRTLGLRLIPGDIVDECMGLVEDTQKAKDAKDPDGEKYKIFDSFGSIGVSVDQIKEFLGHDAATLQPKELGDLRGIFAAIKDGEATWREVMESRGGEVGAEGQNSATNTLADRIKKKREAEGQGPKAAPSATEQEAPHSAETATSAPAATSPQAATAGRRRMI